MTKEHQAKVLGWYLPSLKDTKINTDASRRKNNRRFSNLLGYIYQVVIFRSLRLNGVVLERIFHKYVLYETRQKPSVMLHELDALPMGLQYAIKPILSHNPLFNKIKLSIDNLGGRYK